MTATIGVHNRHLSTAHQIALTHNFNREPDHSALFSVQSVAGRKVNGIVIRPKTKQSRIFSFSFSCEPTCRWEHSNRRLITVDGLMSDLFVSFYSPFLPLFAAIEATRTLRTSFWAGPIHCEFICKQIERSPMEVKVIFNPLIAHYQTDCCCSRLVTFVAFVIFGSLFHSICCLLLLLFVSSGNSHHPLHCYCYWNFCCCLVVHSMRWQKQKRRFKNKLFFLLIHACLSRGNSIY